MIQCKECGFSVNEMMRFALMKNICPSCGHGLLSARDSAIIGSIQNRISSQRFSSGFTESQVYDLSLFIFNELKDGFGKIASELSRVRKSEVKSSEEVSHSEESEESEDDISNIRREVAAEFVDHFEEEDIEDEDDGDPEDIDEKAERLRRLHQQRVLADQAGPKVAKQIKRGGFKGITRSTA